MEKTLDLSHFKVERVLNKSDNSKTISLLGTYIRSNGFR